MKTLVEAPPRRKPINWYRVLPYLALATVVVVLIVNLIAMWPVLNSGYTLGEAVANSGGWWEVSKMLAAVATILLLGLAGLGLVGVIMVYVVMGIDKFCKWWRRKTKEADRRHLTYED